LFVAVLVVVVIVVAAVVVDVLAFQFLFLLVQNEHKLGHGEIQQLVLPVDAFLHQRFLLLLLLFEGFDLCLELFHFGCHLGTKAEKGIRRIRRMLRQPCRGGKQEGKCHTSATETYLAQL
jgi:hypothetical protein